MDLAAAEELGLQVVRVPTYSPEAVAEHTVSLMMILNRRIHRAYQRTRDANFSLDGLTGFNMHGKTAGVIGTGKIGIATMHILKEFGMRLLALILTQASRSWNWVQNILISKRCLPNPM